MQERKNQSSSTFEKSADSSKSFPSPLPPEIQKCYLEIEALPQLLLNQDFSSEIKIVGSRGILSVCPHKLNKNIRKAMFEEQRQQIRRKIKPGNSKTLWDAFKIASDKEISECAA